MLGGLDFSGDGFPDLMVGDLVADPLGRNNAGRAYLFYNAGNLRGKVIELDSPPPGIALSRIIGFESFFVEKRFCQLLTPSYVRMSHQTKDSYKWKKCQHVCHHSSSSSIRRFRKKNNCRSLRCCCKIEAVETTS